MYSRSYPEKPMSSDLCRMKKDTPLPDNYSGTAMRCDIAPPECEEETPQCDICQAPETEPKEECKKPQVKKGLFSENDDLLLLAMLFLFSDRGGDKSEPDLLPILALLMIL